ncbi:TonB-dependent receptor [Litorilituus sediminis]|uniref:TonB-dependent receptor n=1 Tax=Litorilituus sediminis TaxID=718192 RepID=A0A4P6P6V2_9GAMM|nr:TonB-dependent receptor [Litorilituus sediminis]QBG35929.1 TonB-dependent receptor [Litorilituus sediminis]
MSKANSRIPRAMNKKPLAVAVSSALLSMMTLPVIAADEAEEKTDRNTLEVIEVTATKHVTNLMETPIAVTAMNPETLTRQNVKQLGDLSGMVPNLQLGLSNSDSGVKASIRGVSSNNFTEIADPAVGIHIDGIYSPRPQGSLALMFDLEQVEVLRGAQGTLFGRNSTAGVINVIPAKPEFDENYGWTTLQLGNYNAQQIRTVYNFGISDNFALRAALMIDKRDGYINQKQDLTDRGMKLPDPDGEWGDSIWSGPDGKPDVDMRLNKKLDASDYYSNSDQWGGRLTGLWQITDDLAWTMGFEHYQNNGAGHVNLKDCWAAEGTDYACDTESHFDQEVLINVPGKIDMSIDTVRSLLTYDINGNTVLEHRFAYANQKRVQHHDDDAGQHSLMSEVDIMYSWGNWGRQTVDDRATYTIDSEYKSYVNELQLKQTFNNWQYVLGAFWMYENNKMEFGQDMLVQAPWGMPYSQYYDQPKREIDSKAIFFQADVELSEKWTATAGIRYTQDERIDNEGETWGSWSADTPWYYNGADGLPVNELGMGLPHNGTDLTMNMGPFAGKPAYGDTKVVNTYAKDWDQTTWRLGLNYQLANKQFMFASVATGYRAGGFGDRTDACGGGTCADGSTEQWTYLDYDPETTINYELGYKATLLDDSLNLSAVFFFTQYEDMQYTNMHPIGQKIVDRECPDWDPACDIVQAWKTENIGDSEIYGIELEFDYIPWENGHLNGFYAYLGTEITSYDSYNDDWMCGYREENGAEACAELFIEPGNPLSGRQLYDVTGNQLPNSPEHSMGLNYSHYIEMGEYQLVPWVGLRWQDKMYFTPRNLDNRAVGDYQEAYANVDASLKFSPVDEDWYIELYGNNLTDEVVINWMGQGANGGWKSNSYNPPRMYGIRFNISY